MIGVLAVKEKNITCIICPSSCHITVKGEGDKIESIQENTCKRGFTYAEAEFLHPERMITSTIKAIGYKAPVISVRTSKPIPKEKVLLCMKIIRDLESEAPFLIGRVILKDILGTGSDIILTNN